MSFGEFMFSAGFIQKTVKGDLFVKGNYRIPPRNQHGKTLEDSIRRITKAKPVSLTCGADRPHLEAAQPMGPHVSLPLLCRFSTALRIASPPFIQVSLIRGLRIDASAYIYLPAPPPPEQIPYLILRAEKLETLIHMSTRIRASNQENISPQ